MDAVCLLVRVIVANIEGNRPLVDDNAVAETGSDRINGVPDIWRQSEPLGRA